MATQQLITADWKEITNSKDSFDKATVLPIQYINAVEVWSKISPFAVNRTITSDGFPDRIDRVYYLGSEQGKFEFGWQILCSWLQEDELKTRVYGWFEASCDTTGFECRGDLSMNISDSLEDIAETGLLNHQLEMVKAQQKLIKEDKFIIDFEQWITKAPYG